VGFECGSCVYQRNGTLEHSRGAFVLQVALPHRKRAEILEWLNKNAGLVRKNTPAKPLERKATGPRAQPETAKAKATLDIGKLIGSATHGGLPRKDSAQGALPRKDSTQGGLPRKDSVQGTLPYRTSAQVDFLSKDSIHGVVSHKDAAKEGLPRKDSAQAPLPMMSSLPGPFPRIDSVQGALPRRDSAPVGVANADAQHGPPLPFPNSLAPNAHAAHVAIPPMPSLPGTIPMAIPSDPRLRAGSSAFWAGAAPAVPWSGAPVPLPWMNQAEPPAEPRLPQALPTPTDPRAPQVQPAGTQVAGNKEHDPVGGLPEVAAPPVVQVHDPRHGTKPRDDVHGNGKALAQVLPTVQDPRGSPMQEAGAQAGGNKATGHPEGLHLGVAACAVLRGHDAGHEVKPGAAAHVEVGRTDLPPHLRKDPHQEIRRGDGNSGKTDLPPHLQKDPQREVRKGGLKNTDLPPHLQGKMGGERESDKSKSMAEQMRSPKGRAEQQRQGDASLDRRTDAHQVASKPTPLSRTHGGAERDKQPGVVPPLLDTSTVKREDISKSADRDRNRVLRSEPPDKAGSEPSHKRTDPRRRDSGQADKDVRRRPSPVRGSDARGARGSDADRGPDRDTSRGKQSTQRREESPGRTRNVRKDPLEARRDRRPARRERSPVRPAANKEPDRDNRGRNDRAPKGTAASDRKHDAGAPERRSGQTGRPAKTEKRADAHRDSGGVCKEGNSSPRKASRPDAQTQPAQDSAKRVDSSKRGAVVAGTHLRAEPTATKGLSVSQKHDVAKHSPMSAAPPARRRVVQKRRSSPRTAAKGPASSDAHAGVAKQTPSTGLLPTGVKRAREGEAVPANSTPTAKKSRFGPVRPEQALPATPVAPQAPTPGLKRAAESVISPGKAKRFVLKAAVPPTGLLPPPPATDAVASGVKADGNNPLIEGDISGVVAGKRPAEALGSADGADALPEKYV
jgi:hypothetical protein